MILESALLFATDPQKMLIVVVSVLISLSALVAWKRLNKPLLLYAHLLFLLSPLFYFALSINCSLAGIQGLLSWCTALFAKFMIYILPPLMAISFLGGYALLPLIYRRIAKPLKLKSFEDVCRLTGVSAKLFLIDRAKPSAFTLGSWVFVSVGLLELLSKKELEAVLLHELYHVKSRSSWLKFSEVFARAFSPMAWFSSSSVEKEERCADAFAVRIQGRAEYLRSAKQKV